MVQAAQERALWSDEDRSRQLHFSLRHMHFSYGCMVTDIECIIVFWSNNKNLNLALFIFWLQKVSFLVAFKG